jgi:hypothetical protein
MSETRLTVSAAALSAFQQAACVVRNDSKRTDAAIAQKYITDINTFIETLGSMGIHGRLCLTNANDASVYESARGAVLRCGIEYVRSLKLLVSSIHHDVNDSEMATNDLIEDDLITLLAALKNDENPSLSLHVTEFCIKYAAQLRRPLLIALDEYFDGIELEAVEPLIAEPPAPTLPAATLSMSSRVAYDDPSLTAFQQLVYMVDGLL